LITQPGTNAHLKITANGFWLCFGGLLKPKTICQHQSFLFAQLILFAPAAH